MIRKFREALCEIFAAVQACLCTNDKAGTTSDKETVEGGKVDGYHDNNARACQSLNDAQEWTCSLTPEQSIKARCAYTSAGEFVVQAKFASVARDVRNNVMSAYNKCTAQNLTTMFRESLPAKPRKVCWQTWPTICGRTGQTGRTGGRQAEEALPG